MVITGPVWLSPVSVTAPIPDPMIAGAAGPSPRDTVPGVSAGEFTIEFFEDDEGRSPVEEWMDSDLTDVELAALLAGLEHILSHRGIDVCRTAWGKQLGEGVFEFRIRHTSAEIERMFTDAPSVRPEGKHEKVLLRVFCHAYGTKIVLLLNGYDKAADPNEKRQRREISLARRRLAEFKDRQAHERKRQRRGGGRDS